MKTRQLVLLVLAVVAIVLGLTVTDDYCFAGLWLGLGLVLGIAVEALPPMGRRE